MKITRTSMLTGVTRTLDLPVTPEQLLTYQNGELVQRAFPQLDASQREFIMTGNTEEEWNIMFQNDASDDI